MKRVVIIGDLHSGHRAGLTPPAWQFKKPYQNSEHAKYAEVQQTLWNFITEQAKRLQPVHLLIVNGDCIEGKGLKNGGRELITQDRNEQTDMAAECIKIFKPRNILMTYGTPYHSGTWEDWEDLVADKVSAPRPKDQLWVNVDKAAFNIRHKTSRAVIPHGRATMILRQQLWETLWADWEERPASRILIRHHVHYHCYAGDPRCLVMTGPALQVYSQYGIRQCEGIVHVGLVWFDIEKNGEYKWGSQIVEGKAFKSAPLQL